MAGLSKILFFGTPVWELFRKLSPAEEAISDCEIIGKFSDTRVFDSALSLNSKPGGAAHTSAIAFHWVLNNILFPGPAGLPENACAVTGFVGSDATGEKIRDACEGLGVKTLHQVKADADTEILRVLYNRLTRRSIAYTQSRRFPDSVDCGLTEETLASFDIFYLEGLDCMNAGVSPETLTRVAHFARANNKRFVMSLWKGAGGRESHLSLLLSLSSFIDLLFIQSESELVFLAELLQLHVENMDTRTQFATVTAKLNTYTSTMTVVLTKADGGVLAAAPGSAHVHSFATLHLSLGDDRLMQDAFIGGFLAGIAVKQDIYGCVQLGAVAGNHFSSDVEERFLPPTI